MPSLLPSDLAHVGMERAEKQPVISEKPRRARTENNS